MDTWTFEITGPLQILFPVVAALLVRGLLATVEDLANLVGRTLLRRRSR
jgi:hypothetical protein